MDSNDWNARYAGSDLVWSAEPNRFVAEVVGGWPPGRAIDLACGEGRNAIWMAKQGWAATGVDFSDVAIDKARRLAESAGATVDFVCADATSYAPQGRFDLVLFCYLQIPHAEIGRALERAVAALEPGGRLLFVAHALDNLANGVGGPQSPDVLYTPAQVSEWLSARGLTVERCEHVLRPVDDKTAIDLLAIATK